MNIGYFNARGINTVEHWFKLEIQELTTRGHDVVNFSLNGMQPTKEHILWMDFAHFHYAQVADHYKRIGIPFCISPHANDIWRDDGATLKRASEHPNCKFVTYQSYYHKKKFEEWGINKPLVYLPMSARVDLFKRETPYNPDGKIVAGGRLIPKKGLELLKNIENLTIFGDGLLRSELYTALPKVEFTGWLDGYRLKNLMEESKLYLHPSIVTPDGDKDGIPNTIKEALLMQLQVIASPIAGIPEIENITLCNDWSRVKDLIKDIPREPNRKGEKEIRNLYDPKLCVNKLLQAIEDYAKIE